MKLRLALLALISAFSLSAAANTVSLSLKMDLEAKIQARLVALLKPVDSRAQVIVDVTLEELSTDLPGTGGDRIENFASTSGPNALSLEDIQKVDVRIISRIDPLPASLKTLLESSVNIPASRRSFKYEVTDRETATLIDKQEAEGSMSEKVEVFSTQFRSLAVLALVLIGLFCTAQAVLGVLSILNGRKAIASQQISVDRMSDAISNGIGSARGSSQPLSQPQQIAPPSQANASGASEFSGFGVPTLIALLSDCFWCEEDGYAAWIWSRLSPSQRLLTLQGWKLCASYVRAISRKNPVNLGLHQHPCYLIPLALQDVSQGDVMKWLKSTPSAWHSLSPMRQSRLPISLEDRVKLAAAKPADTAPTLPPASARARELSTQVEIQRLTEQDELSIARNPAIIRPEMRAQLPSLVWAALLPKPDLEQLLSRYPAQALAQAWVGPEQVLRVIEDSLPAKKLALVKEYSATQRPSRDSEILAQITADAVSVSQQTASRGEDAAA